MLAASMLAGVPAISYAARGIIGGAAVTQTAVVNEWHPARPVAGMGSVVWTNYNGYGGQLTIDLQGGHYAVDNLGKQHNDFIVNSVNFYTVSQAENDTPGRLQINLAPGIYHYTANVANIGSLNGTIEVKAGQIMGLSFYGGDPKTIVHNHSPQSDDDNLKHTSTSTVFTKLLVAQEDLTAQAR
jgi:hypothetical protein